MTEPTETHEHPDASSTPQAPEVEAPAAPSAEAAPARAEGEESSAEAHEGDDDGDAGADATPGEAAPGAEGDGPKKRRRRRRKKKSSAGEVGAMDADPASNVARGGDAPAAQRREPHVPFKRFVDAGPQGERRHAFAAGEIVAGRVERVTERVIVVDLFGKAKAVIDRWDAREPEELPPEPAPSTGAEPAVASDAAVAPSAENGVPGEASVAEATTSTDGVAPQDAEAGAEAQEYADGASLVAEEASLAAESESDAEGDDDAEAGEGAPADASAEEAARLAAAREPFEPEFVGTPPEAPPLGTIVRGRVASVSESGHIALVNRAVARADVKNRLIRAREIRQRVPGIVYGFNRGGFDVIVAGVRVFCPANGMALSRIDDPTAFIGECLEFTLPQRKGKTKGFVVSRRTILEREAVKKRKALLRDLVEGQEVRGHVTQVREFGAFVDIGEGLEGLIHQSEISWRHGVRPADVFRPGDEVTARVLGVTREGKNLRQARIALSTKALEQDPWNEHVELLREGSVTKGTVVSTTDFGAFVKIAEGIEGLLHITELGRELKHASQAIQEGAEVDVVIDRVDRRQRRISLSKLSASEAKAIEEGALAHGEGPGSLKPGSHVKVVVTKVDHAGVQVQVQGVLGKRGRAFLPMRELGSKAAGDGRQGLSVGAVLDVKVVPSERRGSLRVSVKGFETDTERQAVREYKKEVSKQGFGTFGDLLRAKLGSSGGPDSGGA